MKGDQRKSDRLFEDSPGSRASFSFSYQWRLSLDGGQSSLCLQLSPQFLIIERGPSMLYWNVKNRSDGPLGIRLGHSGLTRVSLDLNLEHIHHPYGSSSIRHVQIYKIGFYSLPVDDAILRRKSSTSKAHQHDSHPFSIDAHQLAESIGIHLFTWEEKQRWSKTADLFPHDQVIKYRAVQRRITVFVDYFLLCSNGSQFSIRLTVWRPALIRNWTRDSRI